MKQKRIRIDVQDKDGAKYDFKIEGNVTKEKVLKIFELMDLINIEEDQAPNLDSVGGKCGGMFGLLTSVKDVIHA